MVFSSPSNINMFCTEGNGIEIQICQTAKPDEPKPYVNIALQLQFGLTFYYGIKNIHC